ncbi:hypothetical protein M9H77_19100 [Catharanthus roseus]|uniref:Uncharacterized protein n=1 Tax=Catharanthus roseus TaxID=4058 RepID=A0ACC0B9G5_CATRO|nr:hypothetical protein M9H77_19100 [Catharanthus roseus]
MRDYDYTTTYRRCLDAARERQLLLSVFSVSMLPSLSLPVPSAVVDGVFLLYGCCDPFNEKALRASTGASFQLPIVSGHPANSANSKLTSSLSRDFADSLAETPLCLILGSEGSGLSENSRQECELVTIPLAEEFESLNVSVAGGIFLYMLQPNNSGSN